MLGEIKFQSDINTDLFQGNWHHLVGWPELWPIPWPSINFNPFDIKTPFWYPGNGSDLKYTLFI